VRALAFLANIDGAGVVIIFASAGVVRVFAVEVHAGVVCTGVVIVARGSCRKGRAFTRPVVYELTLSGSVTGIIRAGIDVVAFFVVATTGKQDRATRTTCGRRSASNRRCATKV